MKNSICKLLCILLFIKIYSQDGNMAYYFKNFPQTPSTSTFLRYGDIQNSEFTGTNSPKIPIHTIQEGDITLPLTIDYVSGNGIKVSSPSSSVGLGWNLGLPSLVQSVLGKDDFDTNVRKLKIDLHYQPDTPWGLLNTEYRYLESEDGKAQPQGYIDPPQIGKYTYYYSIHHTLPVNGIFHGYDSWLQYDTSPDIFTVNLFGEKIEFFISNHKDLNSSSASFNCLKKGYRVFFDKQTFTFTITAPDGIIYEFGKHEEVYSFGVINRNFVLTKIKAKNDNTLTLDYNNYSGLSSEFIPQSKNLNYTKYYYATSTPGCGGIPIYWGMHMSVGAKFRNPDLVLEPYTSGATGTYHIPDIATYNSSQNYLLISKIYGNFGNIDFIYSNREDNDLSKLSRIVIKNSNSQIVKNTDFVYEYTTASNNTFQNPETAAFTNSMSKRLILKELLFNQKERYAFDYYNPENLPRKDSYAVDYWGYYNGGLNNQTYFLNPKDITTVAFNQLPITNLNNNVKVPNINFAQAGLLKKITYPTKGYSLYKYELNAANNLFSNVTFNITQGKGVRLEAQENYGFNSNLLEKTKFLYEDGYSTNSLDLIKEITNQKYYDGMFRGFSVVSMNSTNNYSASILSSGDYVGYGKVTKIQTDSAGIENGRIISNYNINPDVGYTFWNDQLPVSIPNTKNKGIENGKLLSQIFLNSNNIKIKETINEYDTKYSDIYYGTIFSPISESVYICKGWTNGGSIPSGSGQPDVTSTRGLSVVAHYPVFSKESFLSTSKNIEYFNGKEIITNTKQYFNSNNFLFLQTTDFPDKTSTSQTFRYAADKSNTKLLSKNIINTPLETIITKSIEGISKTVSQKETKYDDPNHLNPTSILSYDIQNNSPSIEATYNLYDKGRLLQYTTREGITVTIIWGYNKTQPIAKIEGANYSQIIQAFGLNGNDNTAYSQLDIVKKSDLDVDNTSEEDLASALNNFRNKDELKNFNITTYTYDPLIGVKLITQPSGLKETYKYDLSGKLEQVLDTNDKIIKEYKYNYGPIRYYSSSKSKVFTRDNCGSYAIGSTYTYSIPEGKYISTISQVDADQQAQNDINSNGQAMANTNGTCTSISCSVIPGSGINQFHYGSISINNPTDYRVKLGFKYSSNHSWHSGVIVGKIVGNCIPSTERSSGAFANGIWILTIDTAGNIIAKISSASPSLVDNIDLNFDFTYSIY